MKVQWFKHGQLSPDASRMLRKRAAIGSRWAKSPGCRDTTNTNLLSLCRRFFFLSFAMPSASERNGSLSQPWRCAKALDSSTAALVQCSSTHSERLNGEIKTFQRRQDSRAPRELVKLSICSTNECWTENVLWWDVIRRYRIVPEQLSSRHSTAQWTESTHSPPIVSLPLIIKLSNGPANAREGGNGQNETGTCANSRFRWRENLKSPRSSCWWYGWRTAWTVEMNKVCLNYMRFEWRDLNKIFMSLLIRGWSGFWWN